MESRPMDYQLLDKSSVKIFLSMKDQLPTIVQIESETLLF